MMVLRFHQQLPTAFQPQFHYFCCNHAECSRWLGVSCSERHGGFRWDISQSGWKLSLAGFPRLSHRPVGGFCLNSNLRFGNPKFLFFFFFFFFCCCCRSAQKGTRVNLQNLSTTLKVFPTGQALMPPKPYFSLPFLAGDGKTRTKRQWCQAMPGLRVALSSITW